MVDDVSRANDDLVTTFLFASVAISGIKIISTVPSTLR